MKGKSMLKYIVIALMSMVPIGCYAGSSTCSNVTDITASGVEYNASSSDCVIHVKKSVYEITYIHLPSNPSNGDKFVIEDHTAYSLDQCDAPYTDPDTQITWNFCYPAGIQVDSVDVPNVTVDTVQEDFFAGTYDASTPSNYPAYRMGVTLIYNSSTANWDATYDYTVQP